MSHPGHQFFRVGARVGSELIAGVPQVVNVDALQADSGQRGKPHATAEVRVRKRRAGRAAEDERDRERNPLQVISQIRDDQLRKRDSANTRLRR